ncbi:MAG: type II secretion system F family protein [Oscillospiraceae bacterium]|jgi:tight adherence protein C|nr:type II secretion system F family protein [Oscillospiraceae bacterium]
MHIVILIIATLLLVIWLILFGRITCDDWMLAAYVKVFDNLAAINKLKLRDIENTKKLSGYSKIALKIMKIIINNDSSAKIQKLKRDIERLKAEDLRSINVFAMPGYVLQREVEMIGKGGIHKTIMIKCFELYGKKNASNKTKQLLAKLISYPLIGTAFTLMLGVMLMSAESATIGIAVIGIGTLLVLVLVFAMYDELSDLVRKRRSSISKQFPNVVSKLALLVTSGMIMDRAWKETAYSQESELYQEMRITSKELDNLVTPESAYSNFINRCNTKESAKLASAIMQNLSKGNSEIGRLLKDMAREAWQERRHLAKRDAEKANSKLMIPTMMLFLAILVMLMVPIALNFSTL